MMFVGSLARKSFFRSEFPLVSELTLTLLLDFLSAFHSVHSKVDLSRQGAPFRMKDTAQELVDLWEKMLAMASGGA
jgi:hypothetical protein